MRRQTHHRDGLAFRISIFPPRSSTSQWKQHGCLPSYPQCWCEEASERGRRSCDWSLCWPVTAVSPQSKDSKLSSPIPRKKELETKRNCSIRLGGILGKEHRKSYGTKEVKSKTHPMFPTHRDPSVSLWYFPGLNLSQLLSPPFMIFKITFSCFRPIPPVASLMSTVSINALVGRWHSPTTSYLQHVWGTSNI